MKVSVKGPMENPNLCAVCAGISGLLKDYCFECALLCRCSRFEQSIAPVYGAPNVFSNEDCVGAGRYRWF